MKRRALTIVLALLLIAIMSVSFFACNDNSSEPPQNEGEDKPNGDKPVEEEPIVDEVPLALTSTSFEINGNEMYLIGGVDNGKTSFNFNGHFEYDNRATFKVTSTVNKVNGTVVELNEGNNTFTITLSYGENSESWTATIYRKPTYRVTFKVLGEVVDVQNVVEGGFAVEPTSVTIPEGYEWNGEWGYTLSSYPITEETVFEATIQKKNYLINYYDVSVSEDWVWSFNFDSEDIILPIPQDIDYASFSHWENDNGERVTTIPKGTYNDVNLYARWEYWSFNVNLNFFGATLTYWDFDRQEQVDLVDSYTFVANYNGEEELVPTPNGQQPGIGVQYSFFCWALDSYDGTLIYEETNDGINTLIPKSYLPKENGGSLNLYATYRYNYNDLKFSDYMGGIAYSVDLYDAHDFSCREVMASNTAGTALYVKERKEAGQEIWDVVIPSTYNGKSVYLLEGAFDGVKSGANVTSITINDGVARIGTNTFRELNSLNKVTINGNYVIPYGAFGNLAGLKELTLNGVTRIEDYAFENVSTIEKIEIGNSLTYVAPTALNGLNSATVTNDYTLNDVIYYGNESNNYLILAEGLSYVSSSIAIPDSTQIILSGAFKYNENLVEVSFGSESKLKQIGKESFLNNSLRTASIPESVEYVGLRAFFVEGLTCLEKHENGVYYLDKWIMKAHTVTANGFEGVSGSITLDSDVRGMMIGAFEYLGEVSSFNIADSNEIFMTEAGILYTKAQDVVVRYPTKEESSCAIAPSVKKIAPYAFSGSKISSLFGLGNVVKIGDNAFSSCKYLIQDDLSSAGSLKIIEDLAYYGCDRYRRVVINESVERVSSYAFNTENYMPYRELYNLSNISNESFTGFSDIYNDLNTNGKITIDDAKWVFVKEAEEEGYTLLDYYGTEEEITIPSEYSKIGTGALAYRNFKKVILSDSIKTIGEYAFSNAEKLQSVVLGEGLITISNNAFEGCISLSEVIQINALSIETIGSYSFYNCSSLGSFIVQNSVTRIGGCAFASNVNVAFASTTGWRVANDVYEWNTRTGGTEKDIYEHFSNTTGITDRDRMWFKPI